MFTHYYTQGIVLAEISSGDADSIFVLYTKDFGKISVFGRSIRKSSAKLRAKMTLFSVIDISFVAGKSGNTLTDVETIDSFRSAKKNLAKLSLFYRIAETALSLAIEEEKDESIFYLLTESFKKIAKVDFSPQELKFFYCFFTFQLLKQLGYDPKLDACIVCGEDILQECYFDATEGGVMCGSCFVKESSVVRDARDKNIVLVENIDLLQSLTSGRGEHSSVKDTNFFADLLEEYLKMLPRKKTPFCK